MVYRTISLFIFKVKVSGVLDRIVPSPMFVFTRPGSEFYCRCRRKDFNEVIRNYNGVLLRYVTFHLGADFTITCAHAHAVAGGTTGDSVHSGSKGISSIDSRLKYGGDSSNDFRWMLGRRYHCLCKWNLLPARFASHFGNSRIATISFMSY